MTNRHLLTVSTHERDEPCHAKTGLKMLKNFIIAIPEKGLAGARASVTKMTPLCDIRVVIVIPKKA